MLPKAFEVNSREMREWANRDRAHAAWCEEYHVDEAARHRYASAAALDQLADQLEARDLAALNVKAAEKALALQEYVTQA